MISVDRVYQTVQKILNKEQRGYFPPVEFNLFANQAQIEIFENYFYDLDAYIQGGSNDSGYGDIIKNLDEKIVIFEESAELMEDTNTNNLFSDPDNLYRLGMVFLNNIMADMVSHKEASYVRLSPLTSPTKKQPVYIRTGSKFRLLYSQTDETQMTTSDIVRIEYVRRPVNVEWAYMNVNGSPVYSSANSVNFELHPSELPMLILKICALAGVAVRSLDVTQIIQAEEAALINEIKQ